MKCSRFLIGLRVASLRVGVISLGAVARRASGAHETKIADANPYVLEADHFSRCVTDGQASLLARGDSLASMRAICALAKSARTGEVVRL